mgnify:CR=1 FL=1
MASGRYRRVLLKLSGEVLMGDQSFGIDPDTVARVAAEVKAAKDTGLELCLVIGGGTSQIQRMVIARLQVSKFRQQVEAAKAEIAEAKEAVAV